MVGQGPRSHYLWKLGPGQVFSLSLFIYFSKFQIETNRTGGIQLAAGPSFRSLRNLNLPSRQRKGRMPRLRLRPMPSLKRRQRRRLKLLPLRRLIPSVAVGELMMFRYPRSRCFSHVAQDTMCVWQLWPKSPKGVVDIMSPQLLL